LSAIRFLTSAFLIAAAATGVLFRARAAFSPAFVFQTVREKSPTRRVIEQGSMYHI
jgi:hypothetical protein